jgi:hypothetical protein
MVGSERAKDQEVGNGGEGRERGRDEEAGDAGGRKRKGEMRKPATEREGRQETRDKEACEG